MRIFKTKQFAKFAEKENIPDSKLIEAIDRADRGQIDADLGGGLIKQRVTRKGKSGGYRTIIIYRNNERAFFLRGFAKNAVENIQNKDLQVFKKIAKTLLNCNDTILSNIAREAEFEEIIP
jgi:hypothetical protein